MVTETRPRTRQYRRAGAVTIDLPRPVMEALIRLAIREDRDTVGQARRLIAEGLERAGLLTEREP